MGCSNPHPHGQTWAMSAVPTLPAKELDSLRKYRESNKPSEGAPKAGECACLLCEYAHFEAGVPLEESRIVIKNDHWLAVVPWWATWPFEVMRTCICSLCIPKHSLLSSPPLQEAYTVFARAYHGREDELRRRSQPCDQAL